MSLENEECLLVINNISNIIKKINPELLQRMKGIMFDECIKLDENSTEYIQARATFDRINALLFLVNEYIRTKDDVNGDNIK